MVPAVKADIPGKGANIIKKRLPGGKIVPDQFIFGIYFVQNSMEKKGEKVERQ